MAKKNTATEVFDEIVAQAGMLIRTLTLTEEQSAIDRIRAIAREMETLAYPAAAQHLVAQIAEFPGVQHAWKSTGKHNFAVALRTWLLLLRAP